MSSENNSSSPSSTDLSTQSIKYLNLDKQPFASEILSSKSFFKSPALDKISDSLIHQALFSELLLLVEGPHGSGKTSLFRRFIQADISNTKILSMQAEATDTLVQIQQKMSLHLQDMGDDNHLDDNLKSLKMFDQTPMIVMDNAHVLSDTTLQGVLRYQQELKQEHDLTLKLLMFANTGIADTLRKISDIQPDQMYVQNMPEYSAKQIELFISHKLFCAGYAGDNLLDTNSIQQLLKKSHGNPLNILQLAAPMIDKAIAKKIKPTGKGSKKTLLISLVLIVLTAAGAGTFFLLTENTPNNTPTTDSPVETTADTALTHNKTDTDNIRPTQSPAITPANTGNPADIPAGINEHASTQAETDVIDILEYDEPANSRITQTESTITAANNTAIPPQAPATIADKTIDTAPPITKQLAANSQTFNTPDIKTPKDITVTPRENTGRESTTNKPAANQQPALTQPVAEKTIASSNIPKGNPAIKSPENHNAPAKPEPLTKPATQNITTSRSPPANSKPIPKTPTLHPALKQLNITGINNATWLKQQPKSNWTLQFLGARGPETLLKFTRQYKLNAPAAWYKTQLKGKSYYVLVYGSYPDRNAARKAINELNPQLRAIKPWVKSMKSVQQVME